jgi:hypothetical protein
MVCMHARADSRFRAQILILLRLAYMSDAYDKLNVYVPTCFARDRCPKKTARNTC